MLALAIINIPWPLLWNARNAVGSVKAIQIFSNIWGAWALLAPLLTLLHKELAFCSLLHSLRHIFVRLSLLHEKLSWGNFKDTASLTMYLQRSTTRKVSLHYHSSWTKESKEDSQIFIKAELASPYHLMPTNTIALGLQYERTVLKHTFRQTTDLCHFQKKPENFYQEEKTFVHSRRSEVFRVHREKVAAARTEKLVSHTLTHTHTHTHTGWLCHTLSASVVRIMNEWQNDKKCWVIAHT